MTWFCTDTLCNRVPLNAALLRLAMFFAWVLKKFNGLIRTTKARPPRASLWSCQIRNVVRFVGSVSFCF